MNVTIHDDETTEVHYYQRTILFENAAPIFIERKYSHGGKELLPDKAWAKWDHGKPIESIKMSGLVLKKDRTTGTQRTDIEYNAPGSRWWGRDTSWGSKDAPEWLLELFGIEVPA